MCAGRRFVAALSVTLVAAVAIGACGGMGNDDEGDGPAAADGDGQAAERAIESSAQERAESIVLQLSDFPDGWRASPSEEEDDGSEFRACIGADYSGLMIIGEASSDDFAMDDSSTVSSEAVVFASEHEAEEALATFAEGMASRAAQDCVADFFRQAIEEADETGTEFELGDISVGELSFTPPEVEEGRAYQVVIPFEVTSGTFEGATETMYLESVVLRQGDAVAGIQTLGQSDPLDTELRDQLLRASGDRLSGSAD
jgi:hypothetical protein